MSNRYMGRTLAPAQFESFMDYCDSLKNGRNDAEIDRVKYECAVSEGYIVPRSAQKKPKLEGAFSLGDVEKALQGTVAAFLPHLDQEEQGILSGFMQVMDNAVNTGDLSALKEMAGNVFRDAGQGEAFDAAMGDVDDEGETEYEEGEVEGEEEPVPEPAEEDEAPVPPAEVEEPAEEEVPAEEEPAGEPEENEANDAEADVGCAKKSGKKSCKKCDDDDDCEDGKECKDGKCTNKANSKKAKEECGENIEECGKGCCGDTFRV